MRTLTLAFSPCPNDTFAFHALVHGLVDAPFAVEPVLLDIEELNRHGRLGTYDVSKLSFGVLPAIGDGYRMLRSGAALGRGVGPLVVAREPRTLAQAAASSIAIPGRDTTAFLLLRLAAPDLEAVEVLRYDRILDAVATGAVDAGLIIHESRFTYADHGLTRVADLGEWWRRRPACRSRSPPSARGTTSTPAWRARSSAPSARRSSTPSRTPRPAARGCASTPRSCPTTSATSTSRCT